MRWAVENATSAQLMFWRPVPDYEPAGGAYEPAVLMLEESREAFRQLESAGLFRPGVDIDEALRTWTVLTSGIFTQQMANAPHEPFETGRFTTAIPRVVEMYVAVYGRPTTPAQGGGHHADQR